MASMKVAWTLALKTALPLALMALLRDQPAVMLAGLAPLAVGTAQAAAQLLGAKRS